MTIPPRHRKDNPNLYYAVMAFGMWTFINGMSIILSKPEIPSGAFKLPVGILFLLIGVQDIVGINSRYSYMWRSGLVACMILCTAISIVYLVAFIKGTILSFEGANNYLFLGIIQLSGISAITTNQLMAKNGK